MPLQPIKQSNLNLIILILLGMIWGTGFSIARFAMTNGVPALGYSFWQALGPTIIIGLIVCARKPPGKVMVSRAKFYFLTGLTGIVIPNTSMYFAAPHLPTSIVAMIVNTVSIIAYPLALLAGLELFNWQRMMGVVLAFCGLMLIILPKSSIVTPEMIPWVLSTLITPVSFATCSIYIARYSPADTDALGLSAGMLLYASLLLLPFVCINHSFYLFHFPLTMPDWIILLEIVLSSTGYLLYFKLIKMAGPVYYSLVDTIVVLTGIVWGYIIFGEELNKWTTTAVLMILVAILLVTKQQRTAANLSTSLNQA